MFAVLIPVVAMAIPIVAIVGGITAAILRTRGQFQIAELAMRERIAALERGIDPKTLPPPPAVSDSGNLQREAATPRQRALETAQGLSIASVITIASGIGLVVLLEVIPDARAENLWAIGVLVVLVGVSLGLSGLIVRRNAPVEPAPGA